jgi:hypothetical protein
MIQTWFTGRCVSGLEGTRSFEPLGPRFIDEIQGESTSNRQLFDGRKDGSWESFGGAIHVAFESFNEPWVW